MTFRSLGGIAALTCAATYIFGFVLLVTRLAPLGFGTGDIDAVAVVDFIQTQTGLMILWNTGIYIVNALALVILVVVLSAQLRSAAPEWASVTLAFGGVWATLVLGAGMIANVTVEHVASLAASDPDRAVQLWQMLHAVELGLGGGNEIAGGVWIFCVSLAGWMVRVFGKVMSGLGFVTGLAGLATVLPPLGDLAGAVFGLGAIAWFVATGVELLLRQPAAR